MVEILSDTSELDASMQQAQDAYALETERIERRYNEAQERYGSLEAEKAKQKHRGKEVKKFIAELSRQALVLAEWDERLWITLLDMAMVYHDGRIMFRFKDGTDILSGSDVLLQLIE